MSAQPRALRRAGLPLGLGPLAGGGVLAAATLLLPPVPHLAWRRALIWTMLAGFMGFTLQRLVSENRRTMDDSRRAARRAADEARSLSALGGVLHGIFAAEPAQARASICRAACEIAEAKMAFLLEPDGAGRLVSTAIEGTDVDPFSIELGSEPSEAAEAFLSRHPVFTADAEASASSSARLRLATGTVSFLCQPVLRANEPAGVLVVAWTCRIDAVSDHLIAAVELVAREAAIVMERADLLDRLEALARTDALTGVANRRVWEEELLRAEERLKREGGSVAIALLDLDHFKGYNDKYGHQAGDRVLKEAAAAWQGQLRHVDVLARYGGEEFAVLLWGCSRPTVGRVIERVRGATPAELSCSAGVAIWNGREPLESVVARADRGLYRAKQAGRARTQVAA